MPFKRGVAAASRKAWRSSSVVGGGLKLDGEVDDRDRGDRHAQGIAIELASHVRDDQLEGLGGAGGGRDDAHGGGACPAQVGVRHIQDLLVIGVGVDRGHQAALDLELVIARP